MGYTVNMKILPERYECEVCHQIYDDALECEARKALEYPIGLIYGDASGGSTHHNMTFAVAQVRIYRHYNNSGSWGCRDNYGNELCGSGSLELEECGAAKDFTHPTFLRMVAYLKKMNIPITVWNGKEAVPYEA